MSNARGAWWYGSKFPRLGRHNTRAMVRTVSEAQGEPVHDVFVSYCTRDKPVADAIVSRLEQAGMRCWVAPRDILPGMSWAEAIIHAIETTRLMVVVISGETNKSHHVPREVGRADKNR